MAERLSEIANRYTYPDYPGDEDCDGYYFPDAIVAPVVTVLKKNTQSIFQNHLGTSKVYDFRKHLSLKIGWSETCALVEQAFREFDNSLGNKVAEVLNDSKRLMIRKVTPGEGWGACYPANCHTNSEPFAKIDFSYDETVNDCLYLAHELGHLLAFDQHTAPNQVTAFKRHLLEIHAFFAQIIMYDFLGKKTCEDMQREANDHYLSEMTHSIYEVVLGLSALEIERAALKNTPPEQLRHVFRRATELWFGPTWGELPKAQTLFDEIDNPKTRDYLGISSIHGHAMAAIIATGLYAIMQDQNTNGKKEIGDFLYGRNQKTSVSDLFHALGIVTASQIERFTYGALADLTRPFNSSQLVFQP